MMQKRQVQTSYGLKYTNLTWPISNIQIVYSCQYTIHRPSQFNKQYAECSQFSRCAEVKHAWHRLDNSWPATSKHPASLSTDCNRSTFNISQRSTFDSLNEMSRTPLSAAAMSLRALSYCCKQTTKHSPTIHGMLYQYNTIQYAVQCQQSLHIIIIINEYD